MRERAYKKYIYKQREKRFFCALEENGKPCLIKSWVQNESL